MVLQILLAAACIFVALGLWSVITLHGGYAAQASQKPQRGVSAEPCNACPLADRCPSGSSTVEHAHGSAVMDG